MAIKTNRWGIFSVCAGLMLLSMLYRASNAVIAQELSRDLRLDPVDLGLLGSAFFYSFAVTQLPLGLVLDRLGARRTMIFLNLLGVVGCMIFAQAEGLVGGLIGRVLLGIGMSANMMGALKLFTRWFRPQEFATISGMHVAIGSLGSMFAASPLLMLTGVMGWRGVFYLLATITFLLIVVFSLYVRETPNSLGCEASSPMGDELSIGDSIKLLIKNRSFWAIALTAGLRYGVYGTFQTLWAGPFLMIYLGLPQLISGHLILLISLGFTIGAPLGGWLSDRVLKSRKKALNLGLMSMNLLFLALTVWPGATMAPLLGVVMFLLGVTNSFSQIFYAHGKDLVPSEMAATAMTGINFFVMLGAGLFMMGFGRVLGRGEAGSLQAGNMYFYAMLLCTGVLIVATIIYAFSKETRVNQEDR